MDGFSFLHSVLLDSGAPHTVINRATISRLGLDHLIVTPSPLEDTHTGLADPKHRVARVGTITLPFTIYFPYTNRPSIHMTKKFDIMNLTYDFLLGVDMLPHLFPSDEMMKFLMPPSSLASTPIFTHIGTALASSSASLGDTTSTSPLMLLKLHTYNTISNIHTIMAGHEKVNKICQEKFEKDCEEATAAFRRLDVSANEGLPSDALSSSTSQ